MTHAEHVDWRAVPLCGAPVGDDDCGRPAVYWADLERADGSAWRIYRCARHAGYPLPSGDVQRDGDVVVERAR